MKNQASSLKKAKRHIFDISLLLIFVLGIFLYPNTAFLKTISKNNILELINQERQNAGLDVLRNNEILDLAAANKANDIFDNQIFAHEINDQKFSAWVKDTEYKYSLIGENLAIDFVSSEGAVKAWLESVTHKQNIMNPKFSETGIAVKEGVFNDVNTILIVQIFGTPLYQASLSANPLPSKNRSNSLLSVESLQNNTSSLLPENKVFYFENNYLNSSQTKSYAYQTSNKATFQIKNINNGPVFRTNNTAIEIFNLSFLLTLILSLLMTFVYLISNHLFRKKQIH